MPLPEATSLVRDDLSAFLPQAMQVLWGDRRTLAPWDRPALDTAPGSIR